MHSNFDLFGPAMVMESDWSRGGSYSESNFSFAFNDSHFSNMLLRIEFMTDPFDGVTTVARHCSKKRRRRENVLDLTAHEKNSNGNQPDMDDDVLYENQDEETFLIPPCGDEAANSNHSNSAATVVRVKTLHISSTILAAKSPFFYKLFSNGMSESKQRHITLRINASEEAGLMELLKFMYSNTLNITAAPVLVDVLMVADKFEVSSCMRYLLNSPMTLDYALLYLELPHTVDAVQPLIDAAKQYLAGRYKNITNKKFKEELMALPLFGIEAILASDDLEVVSEDDVYDFALNWGRQKYISLKERREVLGTRLACLIRFPYMTYQKLEDVLTCNEFEHEGASKLVLEALSFKAESISLNQRFVQRAYKRVMFMRLKREECVTLFPSGHVYSEAFHFGGQMFFLSAQCDMDEHDSIHCFSLSLGMEKRCSGSIDVQYVFAVRLKAPKVFITQYKSKCTFTAGIFSGCRNLFNVPWTTFIAEDSVFFPDGKLRLRAQLTIAC